MELGSRSEDEERQRRRGYEKWSDPKAVLRARIKGRAQGCVGRPAGPYYALKRAWVRAMPANIVSTSEGPGLPPKSR